MNHTFDIISKEVYESMKNYFNSFNYDIVDSDAILGEDVTYTDENGEEYTETENDVLIVWLNRRFDWEMDYNIASKLEEWLYNVTGNQIILDIRFDED